MSVDIVFISSDSLAGKSKSEKIKVILKNVREDRIIVLETPLSPNEEKELISSTMKSVSPKFPGIEVTSLGVGKADDLRTQLIKFLGGKTTGLTVIGPSNLVTEVKRDPDKLRLTAGQ